MALRVVGGIARRDWEAVGGHCTPAFVQYDHRRLAMLGTTRGAEAWAQNFRALVELAPDSTYRAEHVRAAPGGVVVAGIWQGTREGFLRDPEPRVMEVDGGGAIACTDIYEPEQLEQALAPFDALALSPSKGRRWPRPSGSKRMTATMLRYRAGRLAVLELHDLEDLDQVVARFTALAPADTP